MGFEIIEQPLEGMNPSNAQQSSTDILNLLDPENRVDQEEAGEEGERSTPENRAQETPVEEPEQFRPEAQEHLDAEDSEQEDADDSEDEAKYTVKVAGEEREVTLNELLEGFQLKSDYTRKTQTLAQREEELGSRAQQIDQQIGQYDQMLAEMENRLGALIPPEPDWAALAQSDPIEHTRQRAAWDQLQNQMQSVQQERQRVQQSRMQQAQQQYAQYMQQQGQKLIQAMPELKDEGKRKEFFDGLTSYAAHEYGFTPQEINSFGDHRLLVMAEKARKFDQLQRGSKGKQTAGKEVPHLPPGPAQRPQTAGQANLRKARQRLARTGSTRDAAEAIESRLG